MVIFSDGLAGIAEQYLRKGSKVYLEGQLQTRKWQDQSGADRYSTEVVLQGFGGKLVMMEGKSGSNTSRERPSGGNSYADQTGGDPGAGTGNFDDKVPF